MTRLQQNSRAGILTTKKPSETRLLSSLAKKVSQQAQLQVFRKTEDASLFELALTQLPTEHFPLHTQGLSRFHDRLRFEKGTTLSLPISPFDTSLIHDLKNEVTLRENFCFLNPLQGERFSAGVELWCRFGPSRTLEYGISIALFMESRLGDKETSSISAGLEVSRGFDFSEYLRCVGKIQASTLSEMSMDREVQLLWRREPENGGRLTLNQLDGQGTNTESWTERDDWSHLKAFWSLLTAVLPRWTDEFFDPNNSCVSLTS